MNHIVAKNINILVNMVMVIVIETETETETDKIILIQLNKKVNTLKLIIQKNLTLELDLLENLNGFMKD